MTQFKNGRQSKSSTSTDEAHVRKIKDLVRADSRLNRVRYPLDDRIAEGRLIGRLPVTPWRSWRWRNIPTKDHNKRRELGLRLQHETKVPTSQLHAKESLHPNKAKQLPSNVRVEVHCFFFTVKAFSAVLQPACFPDLTPWDSFSLSELNRCWRNTMYAYGRSLHYISVKLSKTRYFSPFNLF